MMYHDKCLVVTLPCGFFPVCYSRVKYNSFCESYFQSTENGSLFDPCFHQGYQRTISINNFFKNPCTSVEKKQFPFSQLHIEGEGNYEKCRRNIQNLFNKTNCPYSSCSFNGIYLPPLQGDFGVGLHSSTPYNSDHQKKRNSEQCWSVLSVDGAEIHFQDNFLDMKLQK